MTHGMIVAREWKQQKDRDQRSDNSVWSEIRYQMAPVCNGSTNTAGSRGGRPAFKGPPARPGPFQAPHAHHCWGHMAGVISLEIDRIRANYSLGWAQKGAAVASLPPNRGHEAGQDDTPRGHRVRVPRHRRPAARHNLAQVYYHRGQTERPRPQWCQ